VVKAGEAMRFLRHVATVAWKDLRVELRTREILSTMVFFAVMLVLICSFAFVEKVPSVADMASGILWIAVAFSGTLGLSRAFERELHGGTMRALLLSPADRGAVLLGKAVGVIVTMLIVEAVVVPLLALLLGAPAERSMAMLALILLLATIGFAVVGSVFAGMLLPTRAREVLLAVVLYPVVTPALIAGIKGTAAVWAEPAQLEQAWFWIQFLAVFDAIFITVSLWAFEAVVVE
jgi:heme exporter protein B